MMDPILKQQVQQQHHLLPEVVVASMGVTLKRLLFVWVAVPFLTIAIPVLLGLVHGILNFGTNNHGIMFLTMTVVMVLYIRRQIILYAPTAQARRDALRQGRFLWPLACASVVAVVIRYIIAPFESWLGFLDKHHGNGDDATSFLYYIIPHGITLRLAFGMTILGLVVLLRFVGSLSVVRCSAVPLMINPVTAHAKSFWARCTSMDAILDSLAGASDTPGVLIQSPFGSLLSKQQQHPRRYQQPTLRAILWQLILSMLGGIAVAYLTVLHYYYGGSHQYDHHDELIKSALILTCALTCIVQLTLTTLDFSSHELDPKRYLLGVGRTLRLAVLRNVPKVVFTCIVVPLFSVGVAYMTAPDQDNTAHVSMVGLGFVSLVTTVIISMYLAICDEACRINLCVPGLSVQRLVHEVYHEVAPYLCLDLILNSLLHGHGNLVYNVWSSQPTIQARAIKEEEELQRVGTCIEQMAQIFLYKRKSHYRLVNEFSLEQDVLRYLLLEGLGGRFASASNRYAENIEYWVECKDKVYGEPVSVVLLRGLCTFIGGLGEALLISCAPVSNPPFMQQTYNPYSDVAPKQPATCLSPSSFVTWSLSPGAFLCAEYAVRGAARYVECDLTLSNKQLHHWQSTMLSAFVPVVLQCIFLLRRGIIQYAIHHGEHLDYNGMNSHGATFNPELHSLWVTCEEAAKLIVSLLHNSLGAGGKLSRANLPALQEDCLEWVLQVEKLLS